MSELDEIRSTFQSLDFESVKDFYNRKYNFFDKIKPIYNHTAGEAKYEFISRIISDDNDYIKALIGMKLCEYLENKYNNQSYIGKENPECIIPVAPPASGKSRLLDEYKATYVICDADDIRHEIINFVYYEFFNKKLNFQKQPKDDHDHDNLNDYPKLDYGKLIIDPLRNYINFGKKGVYSSYKCNRGFEPYCPSLIKKKVNFQPNAIDIFLLFCKKYKCHFIYDSPNTEPAYRNKLIMRCNLIGNYNNFKILLLITPLQEIIDKYLVERNRREIRQTTEEFVINKLKEFFKITPETLSYIKESLNIQTQDIVQHLQEIDNNEYVNILKTTLSIITKTQDKGVPDFDTILDNIDSSTTTTIEYYTNIDGEIKRIESENIQDQPRVIMDQHRNMLLKNGGKNTKKKKVRRKKSRKRVKKNKRPTKKR